MKYMIAKNKRKSITNINIIADSDYIQEKLKDQAEHIFEVVIESDEDRYHAYCPLLNGCRTWGRTEEEAIKNIKEVLELYLEALIDDGDPIPNVGLVRNFQDIKPIIKVIEKAVV
jgi:predicted RNase H-like HicB family nuclease